MERNQEIVKISTKKVFHFSKNSAKIKLQIEQFGVENEKTKSFNRAFA